LIYLGEMPWYEPTPYVARIPAVASTDGVGGHYWLGRFLLWHCLAGGGVAGLFVGAGSSRLPQAAITAVGLFGVYDFWRWWRHAWQRVARGGPSARDRARAGRLSRPTRRHSTGRDLASDLCKRLQASRGRGGPASVIFSSSPGPGQPATAKLWTKPQVKGHAAVIARRPRSAAIPHLSHKRAADRSCSRCSPLGADRGRGSQLD
jgi:hypothetical protein